MKLQLIQEYEKKSKQFNFRLSSEEYQVIYKLCKKHNLCIGEFIRKCINEYASKNYSEYCKERVAT
jgi:predicted DNA binding CopG/RHH family protein